MLKFTLSFLCERNFGQVNSTENSEAQHCCKNAPPANARVPMHVCFMTRLCFPSLETAHLQHVVFLLCAFLMRLCSDFRRRWRWRWRCVPERRQPRRRRRPHRLRGGARPLLRRRPQLLLRSAHASLLRTETGQHVTWQHVTWQHMTRDWKPVTPSLPCADVQSFAHDGEMQTRPVSRQHYMEIPEEQCHSQTPLSRGDWCYALTCG